MSEGYPNFFLIFVEENSNHKDYCKTLYLDQLYRLSYDEVLIVNSKAPIVQIDNIVKIMENTTFYKNYTLEKHLKFLSEIDKDYELLYSIWGLNKRNLTQGLNLISSSYPHYSKHDISHSMTIVNNIQCLLGEERIKRLGATDTFLILMACLTHDIGMVLTYKIIEDEWKKDSFKDSLTKLADSNDSVIAELSKLLLSYKNNPKDLEQDNFKWALEVKNAVVILTSEIFRDKHARQSADNILYNDEFKTLADNYYSEQLPNRFIELLADIALLHGDSFNNVMTRLYQTANGYKGDYIHPRFIACLIRLGDLLDFDNNRFNTFSIASIKEMTETSVLHQQKHASVRHMLISPSKIEAELDCANENVYRVARNWFDWLEEEVINQSKEWPNIAPIDLGGLPPIITKDSIKILYKGIQASPELLNLKFTMSQKKMFNILQGGGIYKEPGFAFIREIVQNAFDASKIQMWNDINAGLYDAYFRDKNISVDSIRFPDEITSSIYRQYPVNLTITWLNEQKDTIHIECEDYGTGISEATLLRMTKYVGDSRQGEQGYTENYKLMPYWLRPTAAFGIGLQSIFFVAKTFEMETAYPNEKTKRIIFRSAADNQYCSIVKENIIRKRGTTIKIDIKKEKFSELFGTSFSWDVLDSVDTFKGEGDDIYLAKIDNFVFNTFRHVKYLCFNYKTVNSERSFRNEVSTDTLLQPIIEGDYKYSYRYEHGFLVFDFLEKQFGSSFRLWFNNNINHKNLPERLLLRDVLVSNAKFGYWKTGYLGFEWNLNNRTTDTIVDISRDNLTYAGKEWVTNTLLSALLPKSIELISSTFVKELKTCKEEGEEFSEGVDFQYLNYCLTAYAYNKSICDKSILANINMPREIISFDENSITADRFFEAKTLLLVSGLSSNGANNIVQTEIDCIREKYNDKLAGNIVVWNDSYLHNALMFNFICTEVVVFDKKCKIYKLEKISSNECKPIKSIKGYLVDLDNITFHRCSRKTIYGLKEYPNIVIKNPCLNGFEYYPEYSSCCIYSPFTNKDKASELMNITKDMPEQNIKDYVQENLLDYITPYMIGIIRTYNINANVTDDDIKNDYIKLICDFIKLKRNQCHC